MGMEGTRFDPTDRVLLVISDTTISGTTRLQKYGFLLRMQYGKELGKIAAKNPELEFYNDWEALWYGPFSRSLRKDADACVTKGLIRKTPIDQKRNSYRYELTIQGRIRWRKMLDMHPKEMREVYKKIANLQTTRLELLLEKVYHAYPNYTKHSTIRERFTKED